MTKKTKENAELEVMDAFAIVANAEPGEVVDIKGGESPIFDVVLMKTIAQKKLDELQCLPKHDLTTEQGRKALKKAVSPIKKEFADFETNIKTLKKTYSEIPKKCDTVSKLMRDISEPVFAKVLEPLKELDEQEKLIQKFWKKEGIPHTKYELENGLQPLKDMKPNPNSSESEIADFSKHISDYIAEWEKCLQRIYTAEEAERQAVEKQRQEAERLRLEAEAQRKERERLEAEAAAQRKAQEAIEAEKRRVEQEAEALERQKRQIEQQAVNPATSTTSANQQIVGASGAFSEDAKRAMRRKSVELMAGQLAKAEIPHDSYAIATLVCKAIYENKIPHVRFVYEND